jgi:hypothetical protein
MNILNRFFNSLLINYHVWHLKQKIYDSHEELNIKEKYRIEFQKSSQIQLIIDLSSE